MDSHTKLAQRIESALQRQLQALTVYAVLPGDSLKLIIRKAYGITEQDARHPMALAHVRYFNPEIILPTAWGPLKINFQRQDNTRGHPY